MWLQKRSKNHEASTACIVTDRISGLPEGVIHHVLSLLPAHDAVRTCVLARPWRHLWRSALGIRITGVKGWRNADKFVAFVDRLLRIRRSCGPVESCRMEFDEYFLPAQKHHVDHWIMDAVRLNVQVFRLSFADLKSFCLPYLRLVCQHLVRLELVRVDAYDSILDFSGCPALVVLRMEHCFLNAGKMFSPSLKQLSMFCCEFHRTSRTRISLPSLSEAAHVELSAYPGVFVFHRDLKWCPTFTKLKTLLLDEGCVASDHNALICFLQHSPALEKLTLQLSKASQYPVKTDGRYNTLGLPFASHYLKKVEIKCEEVDGRVHKILSSLSTYGIPLNHIKIRQSNRSSGSGYVNLVCTGFSYN
ncbi:unnamed protein product [Urochloa decumbens]|uniref:F-box domain-containing protein n=1 Tax=Urochloa decumbens TaxID=240449 RepID=A0ABC9CI61_9POAL